MKFWDTAALLPLVVDEPATASMRRLLADDREVVVWMFSSVEALSALARLGRSTSELADVLPSVRVEVLDLFRRFATVTDIAGVKRRAERLVGVHPVAAADAMQLGAALAASQDRPETLDFVTLDKQLARCAQLEGFRVIDG